MIFQWHITEKCNLNCTHCYQDKKVEDKKFEELLYIYEEIKRFLKIKKIKGHINITGGEPLIKKEFFKLIEYISNDSQNINFGVLTNGTLINNDNIKLLSKAKFVQVSIEGGEKTHNEIRGKDNLKEVIKGIKLLKKNRIRTYVSFTASKVNYMEFSEVCKISRKYRVDKVWSDRLIPYGTGKDMERMNKDETEEFFDLMRREKYRRTFFSKTEISMNRALQFLKGGDCYKCSAGNKLITVMTDGTVYPCRRMPIECGNIFEKSLFEIYECELFIKLRNDKNIVGCMECIYLEKCGGGLKCLSYAVAGSPFEKDKGCFL
jgi:radical SAM protein with 4Fe4S-binding SPASM domain